MLMPVGNLSSSNSETKAINLPGLFIGSTLQIQVTGLGTSVTRLIGMEPGNFILIRIPPMAEIWSKRFEKNQCIIRYIFSGWVYAFRCTLLGVIREPCRMAVLSYPEALENINLRKHERIQCYISADISAGKQLHKGIVSDISLGGCSLKFNAVEGGNIPQFIVGEEIRLAIFLKDKDKPTTFNSIVRRLRADDEGLVAGIQFFKADEKNMAVGSEEDLAGFIMELQGQSSEYTSMPIVK